jgi:hypothetical protein
MPTGTSPVAITTSKRVIASSDACYCSARSSGSLSNSRSMISSTVQTASTLIGRRGRSRVGRSAVPVDLLASADNLLGVVVSPTADQSLHNHVVGRSELDDRIEFGVVLAEQPGRRLCLRHRAWKAVEDEPIRAIGLAEPVAHHVDVTSSGTRSPASI